MATMLDCKKIQPLLSEYVDGALPEDTAWQVKLHLSSCAVCQKVTDDFTGTARLLATLPTVETSAGFEDALARRIADMTLKPRPVSLLERLRIWWSEPISARRPVLASAAVFAVLIPVAFVVTMQKTVTQPQPTPAPTALVVESDPTLEQLSVEHTAFSSAEKMGDPSGVFALTSEGM